MKKVPSLTPIIYAREANTSLCSVSQTEIHLRNIPWKGRFDSLHFVSEKKKLSHREVTLNKFLKDVFI